MPGDPVRLLAVAHRAGNDRTALRAALAAGADVVEADVHLRDGRLELHHLTALGPLPFSLDQRRRAPWRLVPHGRPRTGLDDLLDAVDAAERRPGLLLDLKGEAATGPQVAAVLARRRVAAMVCGSWAAVDAVAAVPGTTVVRSAGTRAELDRIVTLLSTGPVPGGVSVRLSLLDGDVARTLRDGVEHVLAWPVNGRRALDRARALGVTGVVTDDAAVLRAARDG